jgi:hypothetical protein
VLVRPEPGSTEPFGLDDLNPALAHAVDESGKNDALGGRWMASDRAGVPLASVLEAGIRRITLTDYPRAPPDGTTLTAQVLIILGSWVRAPDPQALRPGETRGDYAHQDSRDDEGTPIGPASRIWRKTISRAVC